MRDLCGKENIPHQDCISVNILLIILYYILQISNITWMERPVSTKDLSPDPHTGFSFTKAPKEGDGWMEPWEYEVSPEK